MKILVVHNRYYYRGGEDTVVDAEVMLLREHGHEVQIYHRENLELSRISKGRAALDTIWSQQTVTDINHINASFKPDVIHAHNTFPLISPSLYGAAKSLRVPVVQTLHNFRLLCPQAMLLREGRVCEDCVGRLPWRAVVHRCYRNSYSQSAVSTLMLAAHRMHGTWRTKVNRYIVLNQTCREKFHRGGLPLARLRIKPNFVESKLTPVWNQRKGGMFIGRLAAEKGVMILAQAVATLPGLSIDVYGKGPLQTLVEQSPGLRYCGFHSPSALANRLHQATYLVMPSTGVESFGLVAIEAFACGTAVIAANHGGLAELIVHGKTGLFVRPGDVWALAQTIAWAEANPAAMIKMGQAARAEYLSRYTPEQNYEILTGIYREAVADMYTIKTDGIEYAENRVSR
jgi:glycosyltransferase involved in cell wall biosynthesis